MDTRLYNFGDFSAFFSIAVFGGKNFPLTGQASSVGPIFHVDAHRLISRTRKNRIRRSQSFRKNLSNHRGVSENRPDENVATYAHELYDLVSFRTFYTVKY